MSLSNPESQVNLANENLNTSKIPFNCKILAVHYVSMKEQNSIFVKE